MISFRTKFIKKLSNRQGLKRIISHTDNFLNGQNAIYVEQMYQRWTEDRSSVHSSWDAYFTNLTNGYDSAHSFTTPSSIKSGTGINLTPQATTSGSSSMNKLLVLEIKLMNMLVKYRQRCHEIADVYPIPPELLNLRYGKDQFRSDFKTVEDDPESYGFTEDELDIPIPYNQEQVGFASEKSTWTVREAHQKMKDIYAGPITFEYIHISNNEIHDWFKEKVEKYPHFERDKEEILDLVDRLTESHMFTEFCKRKFSSSKRFGVDGCDTGITGIEKLVDHSRNLGVTSAVMGMPHRGRLNILACVFNKPYEEIFTEFSDKGIEAQSNIKNVEWGFSGDVKYHLGASHERIYDDGSKVSLSLLPNPSHLETVNPVVLGKARAKQYNLKDWDGSQVLPVIMHGDAAVAGQGIVYETAQMEKLKAYSVGGAVQVVFNNNIGFTTNPRNGRSSLYCTDIAKSTDCPIIHVNADHPEYVDWAFKIAAEYRSKFKRDIYVDVIGYRIFGHNEQDFPKFTQPIVYNYLGKKEHMYSKYTKQIIAEGIITEEFLKERQEHYNNILEEAFEKSKNIEFDIRQWDKSIWDKSTIKPLENITRLVKTQVEKAKILELNEKVNALPDGLKFHSIIKRVYKTRKESFEKGEEIDWAAAEMMAYATLLDEGFKLRISGEDVERGTFSHRHARIFDQETGKSYNTLSPAVAQERQYMIQIYNSHLAEYAPLGYEYGYSIDKPNTLCIWEAQFGDFANVAQAAIDQLIASGERKWGLMNGCVMLLPHGLEGQGPEHSSARLERYLELCDDDPYIEEFQGPDRRAQSLMANMQVCNVTNPANYFHLLRLQMMRGFRKPLIVMTPKKLLRFKLARSKIEEFTDVKRFTSLYGESFPEELDDNKEIKQIILCSGKVYFDLLERRRELERKVKKLFNFFKEISDFQSRADSSIPDI